MLNVITQSFWVLTAMCQQQGKDVWNVPRSALATNQEQFPLLFSVPIFTSILKSFSQESET